MKRVLIATVFLALGFQLIADEQSIWPELSESEWMSMTRETLMELLETHGVNDRNENGLTALMYVAYGNTNPEVIEVLIEAGADMDAHTKYGVTALMLAAQHNENAQVIEALIEAGPEVDARNEGGITALMGAAVINPNPEVIQALLLAGANPTIRNQYGNTAWDLIQNNEALKGTDVYWELNDRRFE